MSQVDSLLVKRFKTVEEIPKDDWSLPDAPHNPFHELDFLKVVEVSKIENAVFDYLIFYKKNKPIATAVLSCFSIDLSLFVGEQIWVKKAKKIRPSFFDVNILFCGTPISIGHTNFHCIDDLEKCLFLLNQKMEEIAKERKVKILIIKEVSEIVKNNYEPILKTKGWFAGHSLPDTKLNIPWENYTDYLASMKSQYRRQVLSTLASMNQGVKPTSQKSEMVLEESIKILPSKEVSVKDIFEKYLAVMDRATVKLETLNLSFFANLQKQYNGQLKYFVSKVGTEDSCYAICFEKGKHLHFLWTAKEKNKDHINSYVNQLQAMILYAINNGIKKIHTGQTSYYPKMRIGGMSEERFIFFKSLHPIYHPILKSLRHIIFPPLPLEQLQPFKK